VLIANDLTHAPALEIFLPALPGLARNFTDNFIGHVSHNQTKFLTCRVEKVHDKA
jgi:hypothetical protein